MLLTFDNQVFSPLSKQNTNIMATKQSQCQSKKIKFFGIPFLWEIASSRVVLLLDHGKWWKVTAEWKEAPWTWTLLICRYLQWLLTQINECELYYQCKCRSLLEGRNIQDLWHVKTKGCTSLCVSFKTDHHTTEVFQAKSDLWLCKD